MFEFLTKLFKDKNLSEEQKTAIIDLVDNEESFINPREAVVKKYKAKKGNRKAWISYVASSVRMNGNFTQQLEKTVEELFERLCVIVDAELKRKRKNIKQVKYDHYYYRASVFDELYQLAAEVVWSFYKMDHTQLTVSFSYALEAMLSKDVEIILKQEIKTYQEFMPFPDKETIMQFGLTPFGTKRLWWDPSGELRDKEVFSQIEMDHFKYIKKRETKFSEISAVMSVCLEKYVELLQIILQDVEDESIKWKVKPYNYFRKFFHLSMDDTRIWEETDSLPTDLYSLTENRIRKEVAGFRLLSVEESLGSLENYLPHTTFQKIQASLDQEIDLELGYSTITALRNANKTAWNEAAKFVLNQSIEQISILLEELATDPELKKIATKVIKLSGDAHKRILFIFLMEKAELPLTKAQQKEREKFIYPTRQADYQQLLLAQDLSYKSWPVALRELTQPKRREVKLDNELITASHLALGTIIDRVDDYLREEKTIKELGSDVSSDVLNQTKILPVKGQLESEVFVSVIEETEKQNNEPSIEQMEQMSFLKTIVANGEISLEAFKQQANNKGKLYQAYLNELNEVLYEVFDDQVLVIQQQQVIIEDDFIEEMREWVDG